MTLFDAFRGGRALFAAIMILSCSLAYAEDKPKNPCQSGPVYRAFDFWLGKWQVTDPKGVVQGTNLIEQTPDGCSLIEHWQGAQGGIGTSLNYYDPQIGSWRQWWVSPGLVIELTGGLQDGKMVMEGSIYYHDKGLSKAFRGVWTPLPDGKVSQVFMEMGSEDMAWQLWFDGTYSKIQ